MKRFELFAQIAIELLMAVNVGKAIFKKRKLELNNFDQIH